MSAATATPMPKAQPALLPLARAARLAGLPDSTVRKLVDSGLLTPQRGPRGQRLLRFEDLVLLRQVGRLRAQAVPPRRIREALLGLRSDGQPLGPLRLEAQGAEVVLRDRHGARQVRTGQGLLDFEGAGSSGIDLAPTPAAKASPAVTLRPDPVRARRLLAEALAAEAEMAPERAETHYRAALVADPLLVEARLNLAAVLLEARRSAEAEPLLRAGLALGEHALLHFNLALALEDLGLPQAALAAYAQALALDPQLADAHHNSARLLQMQGEPQAALRHYAASRRLLLRGRR